MSTGTQIKNTIPLMIIYQIKHLGVNIMKGWNLYAENYTMLIKEFKDTINVLVDWNTQYHKDINFPEADTVLSHSYKNI